MSDKSMFNTLMDAITSIGEYCTKSDPPDTSLEHFYKTEFYNEGWMLKLLLARLLENDLKDENIADDLKHIRDAAKRGWMSEGRLSAAFTHEQCTHADAVLGDVKVITKSQWGVELTEDAEHFVVVEAKLGSKLSKGVTNSEDFNQAARNVACMVLALDKSSGKMSTANPACFYVIMPECDTQGINDAKQKLKDAFKKVKKEEEEKNEKHKSKITNGQSKGLLKTIRAAVLTWEAIFIKLKKTDEKTEKLWRFYNESLNANGLHNKSSHADQSLSGFLEKPNDSKVQWYCYSDNDE